MKSLLVVLSLIVSAQAGANSFPRLERGIYGKLFEASKPLQEPLNANKLEQVFNVLSNATNENLTSRENDPCLLSFAKLVNSKGTFNGIGVLLSDNSSRELQILSNRFPVPSLYSTTENLKEATSEIRFENSITSFSTTKNGVTVSMRSATKSIFIVRYNEIDASIIGTAIYVLDTVNGQDEVVSSTTCSVKK